MSSHSNRAAGKVWCQGALRAQDCLNPPTNSDKTTPENIQKFTNTDAGRPVVGNIRRHWGKAEDKRDFENIESMCHGLKSVTSIMASDLLNPPMRTLFQDAKLADAESIYRSNQNAPLAMSAKPQAPVDQKFKDIGFGRKTERGENAGKTVNPQKTSKTVDEEDRAGHELYVKTHNDYFVGEQINRNYQGNWDDSGKAIFGIETPHHNDGRMVCRNLRWPAPDVGESADRFGQQNSKSRIGKTKLVSKRVDDFRERTQPQMGKVHDPIKSTAELTQAFGLMLKPDGCGAGDIIHQRNKEAWLLGHDRKRGLLAAVRQHLKKANYHNFKTLKAAFQFYDKKGDGVIDFAEMRKACFEFNLPIDKNMLSNLMATCCNDSTLNTIDYVRFVNLLNWKNKMPVDVDLENSKDNTDEVVQQIDKAVTGHETSSSMINATVGGMSTKAWQAHGVPTVRSDIPAPEIRRVSDHTNYGDELNAHGLLSPSIFTNHGVFESDFFVPRDQQTIKRIFSAIGVKMDEGSWENCWNEAVKLQERYDGGSCSRGKKGVSVECFRSVLDGIVNDSMN